MSWQLLQAAITAGDEKSAATLITAFSEVRKRYPNIRLERSEDIINYPDPKTGMSPLMLAVQKDNLAIVQQLLAAGAAAGYTYSNNSLKASISVFGYIDEKKPNSLAIFKQLVTHFCSPPSRSQELLLRALGIAADLKAIDYLNTFLQIVLQEIPDFDLNRCVREGLPPALSLAAAHGNTEQVKILLKAGASAKTKDQQYATALIHACYSAHDECVEALLECKEAADIDARDKKGLTALFHTVNNNKNVQQRVRIAELLLDSKANPEICTNEGVSVLVAAQHNGLHPIVNKLRRNHVGMYPEVMHKLDGSTYEVTWWTLRSLWQLGADINVAEEKTGDTPILRAIGARISLATIFAEPEIADVKADAKSDSKDAPLPPIKIIPPDFKKANKADETPLQAAITALKDAQKEKISLENISYLLQRQVAVIDDEILEMAFQYKDKYFYKELLFLLLRNPNRVVIVDGFLLNKIVFHLISKIETAEATTQTEKIIKILLMLSPPGHAWRSPVYGRFPFYNLSIFHFTAVMSNLNWFKFFCRELQPAQEQLMEFIDTDYFDYVFNFKTYRGHVFDIMCQAHGERDPKEHLSAFQEVPGMNSSYLIQTSSDMKTSTKATFYFKYKVVQDWLKTQDSAAKPAKPKVSKDAKNEKATVVQELSLIANPIKISVALLFEMALPKSNQLLAQQLIYLCAHGTQQDLDQFLQKIPAGRRDFIFVFLDSANKKIYKPTFHWVFDFVNSHIDRGKLLDWFLEIATHTVLHRVSSDQNTLSKKTLSQSCTDPELLHKLKAKEQQANLTDYYLYLMRRKTRWVDLHNDKDFNDRFAIFKKIINALIDGKISDAIAAIKEGAKVTSTLNPFQSENNTKILKKLLYVAENGDAKTTASDAQQSQEHPLTKMFVQFKKFIESDAEKKNYLESIFPKLFGAEAMVPVVDAKTNPNLSQVGDKKDTKDNKPTGQGTATIGALPVVYPSPVLMGATATAIPTNVALVVPSAAPAIRFVSS